MQLQEDKVESSSGEYVRKVWLADGVVAGPRKLCLFLDAEYYLEKMALLPTLLSLQANGLVPPLACLFVSHVDSAARHADYTCNPRFTEFIAKDVLRWAHTRCGEITPVGHVICGLSLSGLASAYMGLTHPDLFPYALCQSGSFWWNNEWLRGQVPAFSTNAGKFWLSVGDKERETGLSYPPSGMRQEVSQVESVEKIAGALKAAGRDVHYHLFAGGHELELWKNEVPPALQWLIGKRD